MEVIDGVVIMNQNYRLLSDERDDWARVLDYEVKGKPFCVVYFKESAGQSIRETVSLSPHGAAQGEVERMISDTFLMLEDGRLKVGDKESVAALAGLPPLPAPIRKAVQNAARQVSLQ